METIQKRSVIITVCILFAIPFVVLVGSILNFLINPYGWQQVADWYSPVGPAKNLVEEDGFTWDLSIGSRKHKESVFPIYYRIKEGPPYVLQYGPSRGSWRITQIDKLEVTLQDGTVYDVLHDRPLKRPRSGWQRFYEVELPLKFKEGTEVSIDFHCQNNGTDIVISRKFIGKSRRSSSTLCDAFGRI